MAILVVALALPIAAHAEDPRPPSRALVPPERDRVEACHTARRLLASGRLTPAQQAEIRQYQAAQCGPSSRQRPVRR